MVLFQGEHTDCASELQLWQIMFLALQPSEPIGAAVAAGVQLGFLSGCSPSLFAQRNTSAIPTSQRLANGASSISGSPTLSSATSFSQNQQHTQTTCSVPSLPRKAQTILSIIQEDGCWSSQLEVALAEFGLHLRSWNVLFDWFRHQSNFRHDHYTYNTLIEVLGQAQDFHTIWRTVETMGKEGILLTDTPFNVLIRSYSAADLVRAEKIMDEMLARECTPNRYIYHAFIDAYLKEGDDEKATTVLEDMLQSGCTANSVTFRMMAYGFCKLEKADKALDIFKIMIDTGMDLGSKLHNALIHVLLKNGRATTAILLLQEN
ncbi:hypothetical protein KP509_29G060100 [Ceratopteris richardii]|uniref:Pentatricopeptide repeat-containing protein n=1 Tax=Ceratopteris richardii TaxID=49495 RepID=A0A8T2R8P3_CERRI|nr:hypothetical protein KP509_29G060100 [Ceratopteris richardii]